MLAKIPFSPGLLVGGALVHGSILWSGHGYVYFCINILDVGHAMSPKRCSGSKRFSETPLGRLIARTLALRK